MNDIQFGLIMAIIEAAREGRYMHGNGRYFFITEKGAPTCIDLVNNTKAIQADYMGTPMVSTETVNSLSSYLLLQEGEFGPTHDYDRSLAHNLVKEAVNENRLLYTNGGVWTMLHTNRKTVISVDLSHSGKATVRIGNQHSSWKYMQQMQGYRATVSPETRRYMNF